MAEADVISEAKELQNVLESAVNRIKEWDEQL